MAKSVRRDSTVANSAVPRKLLLIQEECRSNEVLS
jgi:hypothetical protein